MPDYRPGDRVTTAVRAFAGYTGVVTRVKPAVTRVYVWVRFDGHPWQRAGYDFAFDKWELKREEQPI